MFGDVSAGGNYPIGKPGGDWRSLVMETVLTAILVSIILNTATGGRSIGHNAAIAVGSTVALLGLFASPISGASMNPARTLGPDIVGNDYTGWWIYILGPVIGAAIAVMIIGAVRGLPDKEERDAAQGGALPVTAAPARTANEMVGILRLGEAPGTFMQLAGRCQGRVTMTAEPPRSPVTEAVRSLEVRWIFPGQLEAAVAGWFARFPARTESREDTYLLDPQLRGLSVKIRGGGALDVKVYCGSPGILEVAGRARGRMESWQKWSFPFSPLGAGSGDPAGWRPVRKRRRISRFSLVSGQLEARSPRLGEQPQCEVELTEVQTGGQDWWTLGFEATGPADLLPSELQATVALVFAQALPGDMKPGPQDSRSYAEWLGQRPGADSHADT